MPLDGHDFLVSQGWSGRGTGLRQGAISRPIAIPQKRNLAGLGKDRDEAFPFWDHLFTAASKSIQLKLSSDDESDGEMSSLPEIKRTATGIISNRRPVTGASVATSGTSEQDVSDGNPRLSLLTIAKRDAARTRLYAGFLRGPILGPDDVFPALPAKPMAHEVKDGQTNQNYVKNDKRTSGDNEDVISTGKRKRNPEDVLARAQRKRERKEQKAIEKEERRALRRERRTNKKVATEVTLEDTGEKEKKKRRKLESGKKEKSKGDCADQVLDVKGKRKEKSRKAGLVAVDIPGKETILENSECAPIVRSTGMLAPDAAEHTCSDQQPGDGTRERRKKKRKREEV
ncbi:hypothetical protein C0993_006513 [Termitomyces sp. T159_Od127]|nr:hypothetical protein C0993_006513 [Termitomyces sp. T159_Od127]